MVNKPTTLTEALESRRAEKRASDLANLASLQIELEERIAWCNARISDIARMAEDSLLQHNELFAFYNKTRREM